MFRSINLIITIIFLAFFHTGTGFSSTSATADLAVRGEGSAKTILGYDFGLNLSKEVGKSGKFGKYLALKKKSKKKKSRKKRKKTPSKEPSPFMYILPFGAGQFYNSSYILGGIFASLQVVGLSLTAVNWSASNAKVDETNTYIDGRAAEVSSISSGDQAAHQAETEETVAKMDQEAADLINMANYSMYLFIFSWIGSSVEAFISGPEQDASGKKKKGKKRRSKKKKPKNSEESNDEAFDFDRYNSDQLELAWSPVVVKNPYKRTNSFGLFLNLKF